MKSIIAAGLLLGMSHGAAIAGPYVNVESNSGYVGSDWQGSSLETHVGFSNDLGDAASWYVQGGPTVILPDGGDGSVELSGKAGGSVALTEKLGDYGEVSFITGDDDTGYGTKVGVKYSF